MIFPKVLCQNEHARRKEEGDFLTFHGCHKWIMWDFFFILSRGKKRIFRVNSSYTLAHYDTLSWYTIYVVYCIYLYNTCDSFYYIPLLYMWVYVYQSNLYKLCYILNPFQSFHIPCVMSLDFVRCKEVKKSIYLSTRLNYLHCKQKKKTFSINMCSHYFYV